ncbi:YnbE family lipoprotein [Desulforapulum autotrophicum]|nr:YnbE family lipoprotein [Desulforapulum autotrophicum]
MKIQITILAMVMASLLASGCSTSHEVQLAPVEIKPIHITIDVNVKVDRALDNFFDDIDKTESQIKK